MTKKRNQYLVCYMIVGVKINGIKNYSIQITADRHFLLVMNLLLRIGFPCIGLSEMTLSLAITTLSILPRGNPRG